MSANTVPVSLLKPGMTWDQEDCVERVILLRGSWLDDLRKLAKSIQLDGEFRGMRLAELRFDMKGVKDLLRLLEELSSATKDEVPRRTFPFLVLRALYLFPVLHFGQQGTRVKIRVAEQHRTSVVDESCNWARDFRWRYKWDLTKVAAYEFLIATNRRKGQFQTTERLSDKLAHARDDLKTLKHCVRAHERNHYLMHDGTRPIWE